MLRNQEKRPPAVDCALQLCTAHVVSKHEFLHMIASIEVLYITNVRENVSKGAPVVVVQSCPLQSATQHHPRVIGVDYMHDT